MSIRSLCAFAVALVALWVALPATEATAHPLDAIIANLEATGVHVDRRVLGEAADQARTDLRAARAQLARHRRDARFVIVPGPIGAPSMTTFARRLYLRSDDGGALLVTAPGRPVVVWGIDPHADAQARIALSGANRLTNPVDRLVGAADAVVPTRPDPSGVRQVLLLFALTGMGAAWATAIGVRGAGRRQRVALTETRAQLRLWIDTLRAQALRISQRERLAPRDRQLVEGVLALCADTLTGIHNARTADDVRHLEPRIQAGFARLAPLRADGDGGPFAGLCLTDPAHGPALHLRAEPHAPSLCRDCRRVWQRRGAAPAVRQVPILGRVQPYTRLAETPAPAETPGTQTSATGAPSV